MDVKLFSDLEGLRIAMSIEAAGREFYQQACQQAKEESHKDLFRLLKREEISHYETFSEIFDQVKSNKEAGSDEYLFDEETSRYLTVLAEGHIFPIGEEAEVKIAEAATIVEILYMAVQAEKDSILFYDELASKSKFPEAKKIFTLLKAEEQTHVVKLRQILDALLIIHGK
ncbi:ferritin family protein [Pelosinus sp. sgz500959]|uniref:ferritin family protein n=1 Tax=Pelosinus sp. sgz500959 TaxID=3242472 RepID=UPI00366ADD0D